MQSVVVSFGLVLFRFQKLKIYKNIEKISEIELCIICKAMETDACFVFDRPKGQHAKPK